MNVKYAVGGLLALLALGTLVAVCLVGRSRMDGEGDGAADARVADAGSNEVHRAGDASVSKRAASRRRSASKPGSKKGAGARDDRIRQATGNVADLRVEGEDEEDDDMSPADRRLLEAIEQGQDDEDLERLVKIIPEVSASTNAEVRSELVDALGWFGVQGMNHLLPFMADSDEDVRERAVDNWTSALGEVEDEGMRAQMIGAVMQVLNDEDALESMTNELIDMDEKIALQTLVDVIEGGKAAPQGVAVAREQYEFLTGDEYTTIEAANQWLAENYEPPASKDGGKGRKP